MASFTCPSCGKSGSVKKEIPAGAKIRCPSCQTLFAPNTVLSASVEEVAAALASTRPNQSDADRDAEVSSFGGAAASLDEFPVLDDLSGPGVSMTAPSKAVEPLDGGHVSIAPGELPTLPPAVHLGFIRKQTCYKTLRMLVSVGKWVILGLSILEMMAACVLAGMGRSTNSDIVHMLLQLIPALVLGLIGCFLAIAFEQASSLMIDVADLLIDQGRKQRPS